MHLSGGSGVLLGDGIISEEALLLYQAVSFVLPQDMEL